VEEQRPQQQKKRRPYARPEIQSSELFERRSLTCGIQANARPPCGTFHQSV
jgi:hypothetical protein